MDTVQAKFTCSQELYGDWVSINKTKTEFAWVYLVLSETQVFGSKYHGYCLTEFIIKDNSLPTLL